MDVFFFNFWIIFFTVKIKNLKRKSILGTPIFGIENCNLGIPKYEKLELNKHTNKRITKYKWKFKCPYLSEFTRTGSYNFTRDTKQEFCKKCKKNVYITKNENQLKNHIKKNHCVIIDFKNIYGHDEPNWDELEMGEIEYHSENDDPIPLTVSEILS